MINPPEECNKPNEAIKTIKILKGNGKEVTKVKKDDNIIDDVINDKNNEEVEIGNKKEENITISDKENMKKNKAQDPILPI